MSIGTNQAPAAEPAIWYVLQLKQNGLSIAKTHLARQGYRTLMPMREAAQNTRFGVRTIMRPLFQGYLFFTGPPAQMNWRAIANTRGVTRIITGTEGQPAQLPLKTSDGLLRATAEDGMLTATVDYQPGDHVDVINGPFAGWLAKVVSADDTRRIQLLVDLMGRETLVDITRRDIEKKYQT